MVDKRVLGKYYIGYSGKIYGISSFRHANPTVRVEEGTINRLIETRNFGFASFTRANGTKGLINLG